MAFYEIIVGTHLEQKRARLFEGMELEYGSKGTTMLSGYLKDQAQLHSVMNQIFDMNLELLLVRHIR